MVAPKIDIGGKVPDYTGTIWRGYITGTDAGTLNLETSIMRLLKGDNPVHVWGGQQGLDLRFEAGLSGLRLVKIEGTMKALALRDPRLGAVSGNFKLDVPDMKLMETCEYAKGTAWTDFLSQNSGRLLWKGPDLEGPVTCDDGKIIADLSGKDDTAEVNAKVSIGLEGSYKADITAKVNRNIERFAAQSLTQSGFHKSGGVYKLTEQGRWQ